MSLLYLDTSPIIYLVEASSPFHGVVASRLLAHGTDPSAALVTSRLTRLECRTKPLRDDNTTLLAEYERFFAARRLLLVELNAAVIERATDLRARYGHPFQGHTTCATGRSQRPKWRRITG